MEFSVTKQHIARLEEVGNLTLESFLSIMQNDLYRDVEKGAGGYDKLPIGNEEEFVTKLIYLTSMIGNIYGEHQEMFTDEERSFLKECAYTELGELEEQLESALKDTKELEMLLKQAATVRDKLQRQLDKRKELDTLLESRKKLIKILEQKLEDSENVQKEIEELKQDRIPEAELELARIVELRDQEELRFKKLQKNSGLISLELETVQDEINKLQGEIDKLEQDKKELRFKTQSLDREKQDLTDNYESLEEQRTGLLQEIVRLKENIEECEKEILLQKEAAETQRKDLIRIEQEKGKETSVTSDIRAERVRLEAELLALQADNGREIGKNKDLQDAIKRIRQEREDAQTSKEELEKQCKKIGTEIEELKNQISEYGQKVQAGNDRLGKIKGEIDTERLNYDKLTGEIDRSEWKLKINRSRNKMLLYDKKLLLSRINKEQLAVANMIRQLVKDQVLEEHWMYQAPEELEDSLNKNVERISEEIRSEIKTLNEYMEILEKGKLNVEG